MAAVTLKREARPARIRLRVFDADPAGAVALELPARSMRAVSIVLALSFVIFAAVEWTTISSLFGRRIDDVFDLTFLLFQGFWVLGWSVGVLILGALTILFAFYSESARIEPGTLVHIAKLGPLKILVDYDLAKVGNVRLERASGNDPDTVHVRFDYEGRATSLGNAMSRDEGQRIFDAISSATSGFAPSPQHLRRDRPNAPNAPSAPYAPSAPNTPSAPSAPSTSSFALIAANLVPAVGVLFFDWDLGAIMLLYWVESGVIAFYTAMKIAIVGKLVAVVAVPFFIGHFGGFMTGHFLLIYAFFLRNTGWQATGVAEGLRAIFVPIWGSIAALLISHGISFYTNFVGEREYEGANVGDLMTAPYHRVMIMHLTLLVGGWIILLFRMPAGALVVLVVLKTLVDLHAHRTEHDRSRKARRSRGSSRESEIYSAAI